MATTALWGSAGAPAQLAGYLLAMRRGPIMTSRTSRRAIVSLLHPAALVATCVIAPAAAAQLADSGSQGNSPPHEASAATAGAPERADYLVDRFVVSLGAYLPSVSTHMIVSTQVHNGTNVNLENRLGLTPSTQSLDAEASWRISKHNFLGFQYFGFGRSSTKQLTDSISWGDVVYPVGARLQASDHLEYYGMSYRYYIWRDASWELGPGIGVDGLFLSTHLAVQAAGDTGRMESDSAPKKTNIVAPLPVIGIYGDWQFVRRLLIKGAIQYMYINDISGIGAHLTDVALGVEWYPLHHVGLGAVYHYVGVNVDQTKSDGEKVSVGYTIQGPALYVTATF